MSAQMEFLEKLGNNTAISGNPYARLSQCDEDPVDVFRANKCLNKKAGDTRGSLEDRTAIHGNPYARLSQCDEDPVDTFLANQHLVRKTEELKVVLGGAVSTELKRKQASKKEFESGCRRIFLQYIPPDEGKVLRPHYRNFIARNENSSPEHRARLLEELSKYDISASGNFQPHFNRETELLTSKKLQQIENAAQKR